MDVSKFVNLKVHDGFIVKRIDGPQDAHAHFKNRQGGQKLLYLIERDTMPKAEYFRTAARRVLSEEEFESLTVKRVDRYYNHSKLNYRRCL